MNKFWEFRQNNSGGHFACDSKVCHFVFIEADTEAQAIARAEDIGIYFDGVAAGVDCDCCGDRWSTPWNDSLSFPYIYSSFKKLCQSYMIGAISATRWVIPKWVWTDYNVQFLDEKNSRFSVVFPDIISYAKYMADDSGHTSPACRIYFADGRVCEIDKKQVVKFLGIELTLRR